jgi:hypothetical protein
MAFWGTRTKGERSGEPEDLASEPSAQGNNLGIWFDK